MHTFANNRMMSIKTEHSVQTLENLVKEYFKQPVMQCVALAQSGSHRQYYRLTLQDNRSIIGAYNSDIAENEAFFSYTKFFTEKGFPVPELFAIAPDKQHYLQSDLGDYTLYDRLSAQKIENDPTNEVLGYYEKVVQMLPLIQLSGKQNFDFTRAYPRAAFDRQSMQWDLNYFKYYFLKLANIPFNEQRLEDDFTTLINYLLSTDGDYFLYRDFQSRNIMVNEGEVYFIDYQGGRKGALQYDIASLLYDAKANLSNDIRQHLLQCYLDALEQHIRIDRKAFLSYFQGFILIRIMQAMGAYGYRGYFERKTHFLQSIPFAVRNLKNLLDNMEMPIAIPELTRVLRSLIDTEFIKTYQPTSNLTVLVQSFSFKKSIPQDPSPNGGGFVFDCRALPNPGREAQYKKYTGKDACVQEYLNNYAVVHEFKDHVFSIIDQSVENYVERNFHHLMISFGCTGGQHRSVYFAEAVAQHIRQKFPTINTIIHHIEQEK